jgi:hypothetical protein
MFVKSGRRIIVDDMRALAGEVVSGLAAELPKVLNDAIGVWSVFIHGSYVRGDFIPGNSDLDIGVIFAAGRAGGSFPLYDAGNEPGMQTVRAILRRRLQGRRFHSHHPQQFDLVPLLYEWIPRRSEDIALPTGTANFRYFNLFLFDLLENLRSCGERIPEL